MAAWLEWRQKNKPNKPTLNPISRPPQAFANLLLNTNSATSVATAVTISQQQQFIRATQSAPTTPAKLSGLTAVIRAQQPANLGTPGVIATSAVARSPVIQQAQPQKVHIQAGQHQQSIVLPVRTTPLTTQGNVTAAVTSVSFPVTSQHLTTPSLPNHPAAGTIQTVKIGGGQAQVNLIVR